MTSSRPPILDDPFFEPKVRFETLPEPLQRQHHHSAVVHMHVSAYCRGAIDRMEMLERLCAMLVEENAMLRDSLLSYTKWFGSPPEIMGRFLAAQLGE